MTNGIIRSWFLPMVLSLALVGAGTELWAAELPPAANVTATLSNTPVEVIAGLVSAISHKEVAVPVSAYTTISYKTEKPSTGEEVLRGLRAVLASNNWHVAEMDETRLKFVQGSETNRLAEIPRIEIHYDKDTIRVDQTQVRLKDLPETLKSTTTPETEVWIYDDANASRGSHYQFKGADFFRMLREISGPVKEDRVYEVYRPGERGK